MIDRKEVELLIRAQLKGGRDLAQITKSIADLEDAIEKQAAAAKRGESAYEGLKAAGEALKAVQQELGARGKALANFDELSKRIDAQRVVVENARKALEAYTAAAGDDRTAAQQKRVQALTATYERAQKRLDGYQRSFETLSVALRESGDDTSRLAEAQRRVAEQQSTAAAAINRVNQELIDYNTNVRIARDVAQRKAEADRQAARDADLFAAAEKRAADAAKQRADEADRISRIHFNRKAQIAADRNATEEEFKVAARARELAALRADIERRSAEDAERQAQTKKDTGLRQQADDAERAARGYSTLARASADLRPRVVSLREAIDSIRDPSSASVKSLAAVEESIAKISKTIAASKGPIVDYAVQFKELQAAQKAISGQAGLVDQFRNQIQVLRESRAEFVAARAQVQQYAAAVRQGGDAGQAFVKPLSEAQARLKTAAAAFREQANATRETRDALRQAGLNTTNLAGVQDRLISATRNSVSALRQLNQAVKENGEAVSQSGRGFSLFRDEGRTTLSLVQRLRGEVLALAASCIGVQGAIGLAGGALKAFNEQQGLRNGLAFALGGDPQQVGDEIRYIREQAERLGISFEEVSKSYAKFAAAGVKSGASILEVREIFESFAEVGRVLNLSPDAINGIFNALGQSFSKGKIQAEELRQQIGERLPGAFAFAQQALKNVFPDLNKALEQGQVGAENLLVIAQSVRQAAQTSLQPALKSLDAEQQRFNNSVLEFKLAIAESGFADAYVGLLKQLTEFFRSTDGKEFAKTIADIGKAIISAISFAVTFRDEIGLLFSLFAAVVAAGTIAKVGAGFSALAASLTAARIAAVAFTPVALTLTSAVTALAAAVGVFIAGYSLGAYLRDQNAEVRQFGVALVVGLAEIWSRIKFGAMEFFEELPRLAENALRELANKFTIGFRSLLTIIEVGARALGFDSIASGAAKALDQITLKMNGTVSSRVAQIRKEAAEDLKRIREIGDDLFREAAAVGQTVANGGKVGTPKTTTGGKPRPNSITDDSGIKKRASEIEALRNALEGIEAKTFKKQEDTLASLLAAIDKEYADLERRIGKLGGKEGAEFAARFKAAISNLRTEVIKDFNEKVGKEQAQLQAKLEQIEAAAGKKQKEDLQARLDAIPKQYEETYREIAALRQRLLDSGQGADFADAAKGRLDAAIAELKNAERLKFLKEQLAAEELRINDLLKARQLAIQAIENEVVAGNLSRNEADAKILSLIRQLQPGIDAAAQSAREFVEANRAAFDPAAVQEFLNKLAAATNSGRALATEFNRIENIIKQGVGTGIDNAFNALYESLGKVIQRTGDWGDVFDSIGKSILQTLADILFEIGKAIIKQQLLLVLKAIGVPVPVAHTGMVVGQGSNRSRSVSPLMFANAPRYHSGGVAGLAPNEYPAILKKNEEVLTESDPRNVLNGGAAGAQGSGKAQRFVLVDDLSRVAEAMSGAEGEEVTLLHLRKNIPTLRQWIKGG